MVRIRMQRLGRTHRPFYRINAIDIRTRRNGKVIENLGWYNPMAPEGQEQIHLEEDKIREWLGRGAQPSETVMDMLGNRDLLPAKMKTAWEAERDKSRNRVAAKQAMSRAEAALKAIQDLGGSSEADPAEATVAAEAAVEACKKAVSSGRVEKAESAANDAEAALDSLKKADEKAKAEAEAKATADGEAKAAEEAAAGEGGEEKAGG